MEQNRAGGKHSLRWEPAGVGFLQKTEATAPGARPPASAVSRPAHTQRTRALYTLGTLCPDHTPGHATLSHSAEVLPDSIEREHQNLQATLLMDT